jgi:hypothetical protein
MLVQKIRPSIRLLCAGIGLVLLIVAVLEWSAGYGLGGAAGCGIVAVVFLGLAAVGMLEDDGEEPGSERFHELADPARALTANDPLTSMPSPPEAGRVARS